MSIKPPDPSPTGRYSQVHAARLRARWMLYHGAKPLIDTTARRPEKIAVLEVQAGACAYEIRPKPRLFIVPKSSAAEFTPEPEAA